MRTKTKKDTEAEKKTVQVQMPSDLWQEATNKAHQNDLTFSQVVRKLLTDYINDPQGRLAY